MKTKKKGYLPYVRNLTSLTYESKRVGNFRGETQKVALGRALGFSPSLLILDEPTANIDPATTGEIERMLFKINKEEGTTILFVTHNLVQAKRVCNHMMFLHEGRLIEEGPLPELLVNPKEELTRQFITGELLF